MTLLEFVDRHWDFVVENRAGIGVFLVALVFAASRWTPIQITQVETAKK